MATPLHLSLRQYLNRIHLSPATAAQQPDLLLPAISTELEIGLPALEKWRSTVAESQSQLKLPAFIGELGVTVSPFVKLIEGSSSSSGSSSSGFSLVARRPFPAGVFLASVPASSILFQDSSSGESNSNSNGDEAASNDGVAKFLGGVEQLSAQLLTSLVADDNKFHSYASFLQEYVTPPKNLPFIVPGLRQQKKRDSSSSSSSSSSSPAAVYEPRSLLARALVSEFERRLVRYSSSPQQDDEVKSNSNNSPLFGVPPHHLRWAAAMVLSRRVGGSMLVPFVDMINHSPNKSNAFYTMAASTPSGAGGQPSMMTGLDLVDNMFAGVSTERLLEPHLHVFAIRPVTKRGQEITLSYSDVDPRWTLFESERRQQDEEDQPEKKSSRRVPESDEDKQLTDCGEDIWQLLYGFTPQRRTDSPLRALQQVAEVVTRSRLARRKELFPLPKDEF